MSSNGGKSFFRSNLIFSIISMIVQFLQSLVVTSYVQRTMGIEAYGYISVVVNIVNIARIITVVLTSVCSRFLVVEFQRKDDKKISTLFNTIFITMVIISIICAIGFAVCIININNVMTVSPKFLKEVQILMFLVAADFLVQLFQVPYLSVFCYEDKLYVSYVLSILCNVIKVGVTILIFELWRPVIWAAYIGMLFMDIVSLGMYVMYTHSSYQFLRVDIRRFNVRLLKEVLASGVWSSIGRIGGTITNLCSTYLVNIWLGVYLAGIYGTIAQLQSILSFITVAIVNVFLPKMFREYADENISGLAKHTREGLNLINSLLGVIVGGLIVYGNEFMALWITEEYLQYEVLIVISVCYLELTYSIEILGQLMIVFNKTKITAIASIVAGVFNIGLAYFFVCVFRLGVYGVALAQMIVMILRCAVWMPMYASKLVFGNKFGFFKTQMFSLVSMMITVLVGSVVVTCCKVYSWTTLIVSCMITGIVSFLLVMFLNKEFRKTVLNVMKNKM